MINVTASLYRLFKMSNKVEIYTWAACPFCVRAKALLKQKGVEFIEYGIDGDESARATMAQRANGRRSVPQIFIDDQHIGGCDDIHALDAQGKLDALLSV
jgi:glutaredoxin 3